MIDLRKEFVTFGVHCEVTENGVVMAFVNGKFIGAFYFCMYTTKGSD